MTKTIATILFCVAALLVFFDFKSKKESFEKDKSNFIKSLQWKELLVGEINQYFFDCGWYPDSLSQIRYNPDSLVISDVEGSGNLDPYIDPFSGNSYFYLPVLGDKSHRPEGYYLLSAGIDKKINNSQFSGIVSLYDSLNFNYWNYYFGNRDLLVTKQSIDDWVMNSEGVRFSLESLYIDFVKKRENMTPRNVLLKGVVIGLDYDPYRLIIGDNKHDIQGICFFAPSVDTLVVGVGDQVEIHGIYAKTMIGKDTIMRFNNCILISKSK